MNKEFEEWYETNKEILGCYKNEANLIWQAAKPKWIPIEELPIGKKVLFKLDKTPWKDHVYGVGTRRSKYEFDWSIGYKPTHFMYFDLENYKE